MPRITKLIRLIEELRECLPGKNRVRANRILMQYGVVENLERAIKNIKEEKHEKN